jgi:hypothetical protein
MPPRLSARFTLSIALVIFVLAALWLTAVPGALRPSTYVSVAALLTGLAAITMKTYMSGLATLIHETALAPTAASAAGRFPAPRIDW